MNNKNVNIKKNPLARLFVFIVVNLLFSNVFSQTSIHVSDFRDLPKIKWEFKINSAIYSSPF